MHGDLGLHGDGVKGREVVGSEHGLVAVGDLEHPAVCRPRGFLQERAEIAEVLGGGGED